MKKVRSLLDQYENYKDLAANITLTGILAHESALKGGEIIRLPEWSMSS